MNVSKISLCCVICLFFFHFISFGISSLHATKADNERLSFDFDNCTISDVLRQMTKVTGIEITINKNKNKGLIRKSYNDQTIDQILWDLFRKDNCAVIWSYGDNGLDAIGILIFDGDGSGDNFNSAQFLKERRTNAGGNAPKRGVSSQRIVRTQLQKNGQGRYFSLKDKFKKDATELREPAASQYVKTSTSAPYEKFDNQEATLAHGGTTQDEDDGSRTVSPPPEPEERHGLEPPPMPPGLSY